MGIIHIRIDDRLIHGQVAAFWCNSLKANRIMVANDAVAKDELQKNVLRMVAPAGVRTSIITKQTAATNIKAGKYDKERVLLILKSPQDALDLINLGVDIKSINVGNMAHKDRTIQIKRSINVTEADIENFKKLSALGIEITAIMVPDEPATSLMDYIKKANK
ncbi:PTS system mannose/fructose/N-acetylgalactosamine-transporter subunit IIB [Clostridium lundense]|uniref:PTS system mannose/fructose/N-acetylgalactosamine-transporter subunit IIB n=1 Tax=Clostridium lundense TaxID=319475 RepID=UPI0006843CE1|nr:PTS sugar transporter subunit IIB [Clostridium lundense]